MVKYQAFMLLCLIGLVLFFPAKSFAEPPKFTIVLGQDIQKNPTAAQILKNIEISKQRIAQMLNATEQKSLQQKFIEEQRALAKAKLEKDLAALNKKYDAYSPKNSFSRFVAKVNGTEQALFWDQFNYMSEKIKLANQAKELVLKNGGSFIEAQKAYIQYASLSRVEMIKIVSDLNIKYGFTDTAMESYFDEYGKLPRYQNDEVFVCYGCEKYEKVKEQLLEDHQKSKISNNS